MHRTQTPGERGQPDFCLGIETQQLSAEIWNLIIQSRVYSFHSCGRSWSMVNMINSNILRLHKLINLLNYRFYSVPEWNTPILDPKTQPTWGTGTDWARPANSTRRRVQGIRWGIVGSVCKYYSSQLLWWWSGSFKQGLCHANTNRNIKNTKLMLRIATC